MKLLHGDCLVEMKNIPSNSIDCLLTDPPYGTNDKYKKSIKRGNNITGFNVIDWDTTLPTTFLNECFRIMKNDTWGVVFIDKKEVTTLWNFLENIGFFPRNTFYWIKPNKAPTPRSNFKSAVETCIVFTKGRTNIKWNGGGNQNNFIVLPFVSGVEKVDHPTQKPLKLMLHLIKLFTNKNDVIFDPYMGSGTTGVAAKLLERDFIGIELNKPYFNIAFNRINSIVTQEKKSSKFFKLI